MVHLLECVYQASPWVHGTHTPFFHPFFLCYLLGLPICFLFEFCLCLVEMVILIPKTVAPFVTKKASAIKGQWSDTWLQAMVWNTRLGARRSQVDREEGPQLRQKQELLIFSTIDSLQRSHNKWQHACVIFPIRENMYHGVKYFFLLWSWISSI